jgi:hypothetical protein
MTVFSGPRSGGVNIVGKKAFDKRLRMLAERYPRAMGAALHQEAAIIFAASQRIVPVDTGRLRASGIVPPPEFNGSGNITQRIAYGTDYALALHSPKTRTYNFHGTGQTNYLKQPFQEKLSGLARRLAKRTEQNEAQGVGLTPLPSLHGNSTIRPSEWASGKRKSKKKRKKKRTRNRRGQFK